jgi:SAM-dependent methyltransferase
MLQRQGVAQRRAVAPRRSTPDRRGAVAEADRRARELASAISHGDLAFHDPLDPERVDEIVALAGLTAQDRVLDVGCGPGELLIRIAERHGCAGVGIDAAPNQIMAAVERAARRAPAADLRFEIAEAAPGQFEPGSFALAACLGSSHALGGTRETLAELREVVRAGGHVLLADGFWDHEPGPEYLEALGATRDELGSFGDLVRTAQQAGLEPVYCHVTTGEEWDRYEWRLILNAQRHADAHPADPVAPLLRERAAEARARLAAPGGRGTLGFAALLLLRTA